MNVKALLEKRIELSFLLDGSKSNASEYTSAAYLYLAYFKSSLPLYLSCSPLVAFLKIFFNFSLSGSYLSPSWKNFLALPLSPE